MKFFVSSKIHGITVTQKSVHYNGSVPIDAELMTAAGIEEYEQVHVVNLSNGERWVTYAIPAPKGVFSLNGGGARLGEIGDSCVIMTYAALREYVPAKVVHVARNNEINSLFVYHQAL
jgi:aspartate 1-decarboxylase